MSESESLGRELVEAIKRMHTFHGDWAPLELHVPLPMHPKAVEVLALLNVRVVFNPIVAPGNWCLMPQRSSL